MKKRFTIFTVLVIMPFLLVSDTVLAKNKKSSRQQYDELVTKTARERKQLGPEWPEDYPVRESESGKVKRYGHVSEYIHIKFSALEKRLESFDEEISAVNERLDRVLELLEDKG